jgi:type 1 glutamine amidotransferase
MFCRTDRAVMVGGLAIHLLATHLVGPASADDAPARPAAGSLRVLILTGRGDHDWRVTTPFLRRILADTGRFDVRVCEAPAGLTARTLADFDVLVDDRGGPAPGDDTEKAVTDFVESGKGLVITHSALGSWTGRHTPEGGRPETAPTDRPASARGRAHTPVHFLEVKIIESAHPIVRGLDGRSRAADAVYRGLTIPQGAEVLATARDDSPDGGNGRGEPALFVGGLGKGRVFATALGHDLAAMREGAFVATFARGTEWAATGTVTLPADLGPPRPDAGAVRGLLITGGHDHEASFYTLFDGYKDLAGMPVAPSASAFQRDLRDKFDVVIMYDFSRDLDETGRKNLRDFVAGGKGVVVLHHALLNYPTWPWWSEEVAGGRYRLRREGSSPSSTVKDGQQIFVTPAGPHPILSGLSPFHIVDETYKGMWISDRVRPLLTTDNPNSDRYLAWVGPCATSRVVAIQLGHGPTAFGHPSYRALVHNAILWAAGRIR